MVSEDLRTRAINTIRFLSADAIQEANSGHPGLPMGTAAIGYSIWMRMVHNPANPHWDNRDRFILSGGHGSMLLYSLLYLTGYDLALEELKSFRQWGSKTPGHPEYGLTPGVETTTGPLGQGFGNGVGMAIAEAHLASTFNKQGHEIINHYIYTIVTDGDLMEGVTSEAASLAGHLRLGKLIYFYDDNRITIDGSTDLAFTEDRAARFKAYGWHVLHVNDGNDVNSLDNAIDKAKNDPRPSLIICRTQIGYGLPTRQGTRKAHGEPPGDEELNGAKKKLGWPIEPRFYVPEDVLDHFRQAVDRGKKWEAEWQQNIAAYKKEYPKEAAELFRRYKRDLPPGWEQNLPEFPPDEKGMATRASSSKILNALASNIPELIGGSADLAPSTKTWIEGADAFQPDHYDGRNFHFGIREHAMGTIVNGMALHKGVIPFGATFFVFTDYMRPAIRVSAISGIPSIWVFTHDSIGVGEDGPTHQPVEHLAAMRAIPNLPVIRPADANEVREAWKAAIERQDGPTAMVFSRQNTPTLDRSKYAEASGLHKGAYILADLGDDSPKIILIASGTEVGLIVAAGEQLAREGTATRIVSFPCWKLFGEQDKTYQEQVFPPAIQNRLAVEAGVPFGWRQWVGLEGKIIGVPQYGASAPSHVVYEKFGLTVENIIDEARSMIK